MGYFIAIGVGLMLGGIRVWVMTKHKSRLLQKEEDAERLRRWRAAEKRSRKI